MMTIGTYVEITRRLYKAFLFCFRANEQHYLVKNWPARKDLTQGSHNVLNSSLIERSKILLLPLYIKLGLAKQLVKALKPTRLVFCHITQMFPSISEAKLKVAYLWDHKYEKYWYLKRWRNKCLIWREMIGKLLE